MAGIDITTVKELLGHKDLKMTLRYSHLAPSHKLKAIITLDRILTQQPTIQKLYNSKVANYEECRPRLDFIGGAEGIRTPDLLNAIQTRSQLRHSPT